MVSYNELFQICVKFTAQNYYVGDVIPEKKLANARKRYPIPDQERVVALIDTTVFGSAKAGLAIGETGLYWRNATTKTKQTYMSWREFAGAPIVAKGILSPRIEIGEDSVIELSGSAMGKQDVVRLLSAIQHAVRSGSISTAATSAPSSVTSADEQWMVAVGGRQYGPYDLQTIRTMVTQGRITPSECWVWREGMSNWERFMQVPTLAALLHDTPRSQTMPPPLPVSAPSSPMDSQLRTEAAGEPSDHTVRRSFRENTASLLDLNHAPVDALLTLPGMTWQNAQRLVRERERRGGFNTVEEVGHFLKLQPHKVERLRWQVSIKPYEGSSSSTGRVIDF